ncbi:MAG: electron transfer flavoprotein subunit alpha/FixB family protein [Sciscionella sp.]
MLLTLIESHNGALTASSAGALAFARGLGDELGVPVEGVTFTPASEITEDLLACGVSTMHAIEHEKCSKYAPECWGAAMAQLLRHTSASGLLAASTDRGNEIMAQAAARTGLPLATNCVSVSGGDPWTLVRQRSGGVLLEEAELNAPIKLVTVAPGAAEPAPADPAADVSVVSFAPQLEDTLVHSTMVGRTERESGISLATAGVVVSGGRGVGSAEGFAPLAELATLLDGAVGCSRVATNNGWRPHSDQVGLTGTKIAPALYIACGISGASQHWVGCMDAKRILAINIDGEAPMVTRATYAVIGDVHEVLAAVLAEIKKRQDATG